MLNFFSRSVFFHGGKERLERFVTRENGKLLANQRFSVVIKSTKVKPFSQIPFCFICWYQKDEGGYQIHYAPLLSVFGVLRLIAVLAVVGLFVYEKQLNPYITYALTLLLYVVNYYTQRSHCIQHFEEICQK